MEQHVGRLGRQAVAVAAHRLDHRLDRLLAELARAGLGPARQQPGGPGRVGVSAAARLDGGGQTVERVGHDSLTGMPAAAMWALAWPIVKVPK
jgi:hypothetical protein